MQGYNNLKGSFGKCKPQSMLGKLNHKEMLVVKSPAITAINEGNVTVHDSYGINEIGWQTLTVPVILHKKR